MMTTEQLELNARRRGAETVCVRALKGKVVVTGKFKVCGQRFLIEKRNLDEAYMAFVRIANRAEPLPRPYGWVEPA